MATVIPADAKDKAVYLYKGAESRRVDLEKNPNEEAQLIREGWSRRRFAQMLFHSKLGQKIFHSPDDVNTAKAQGWSEEPLTGEGHHEDAVHPHENDDHRKIMLAEQAPVDAAPKPPKKAKAQD